MTMLETGPQGPEGSFMPRPPEESLPRVVDALFNLLDKLPAVGVVHVPRELPAGMSEGGMSEHFGHAEKTVTLRRTPDVYTQQY